MAQGTQDREVEQADGDGGEEGDLRRRLGRVGERRADEVRDARAGRDADGEGDLEGQRGGGREHGLGGEEGGAEVGGGEGQDLEGEAFGFDHEEAREREPDHRAPVLEGPPREAGPAGAAGDETHVEGEEKGEQVVGDGDGDGGAFEAPLELLGGGC